MLHLWDNRIDAPIPRKAVVASWCFLPTTNCLYILEERTKSPGNTLTMVSLGNEDPNGTPPFFWFPLCSPRLDSFKTARCCNLTPCSLAVSPSSLLLAVGWEGGRPAPSRHLTHLLINAFYSCLLTFPHKHYLYISLHAVFPAASARLYCSMSCSCICGFAIHSPLGNHVVLSPSSLACSDSHACSLNAAKTCSRIDIWRGNPLTPLVVLHADASELTASQ